VLEALTEGERSVADLIAHTRAEASHLSQQLGVLRRAGVLVSRIMTDVEGVRNLIGTGLVAFGGMLRRKKASN